MRNLLRFDCKRSFQDVHFSVDACSSSVKAQAHYAKSCNEVVILTCFYALTGNIGFELPLQGAFLHDGNSVSLPCAPVRQDLGAKIPDATSVIRFKERFGWVVFFVAYYPACALVNSRMCVSG
jgi:hypothetical protein